MKHLSKLSPAESLLVLQDVNSSIKELLKVTFMDLLLKQVLTTFEVERQPNPRDRVRVYKYVKVGKNFFNYQPLPHENVFLSPFQKNVGVNILFQHIVKMGYENSASQHAYHCVLLKSPHLENCFSRSILDVIVNKFSITAHGKELRTTLQNEIQELEKTLPDYINNDQQKALGVLTQIKGNVFLLTNLQFDLLQQLDKELISEMNQYNQNSGGAVGCFTLTVWDGFGDYSSTFDSSCSGGAGCSGGGCSGCSGCGGCGG